MSIFEENEEILEKLEQAEARVEKIRIEGSGSADPEEKKQLALEIKSCVSRLVENIEAGAGDVQALGGALVLVDLLEVLKRYNGVFGIPRLDRQIQELETMWENAR